MAKPPQWTPFRSYFDLAEMAGIELDHAAAILLSELRNPFSGTVAQGILREWDLSGGEKTERLPRKASPLRIPAAFWTDFSTVTPDCDSYWGDNEEDEDGDFLPYEWCSVDWISGFAQDVRWTADLAMLERSFGHLEIQTERIQPLIRKASAQEVARPSTAERTQFIRDCITARMGAENAWKTWRTLHPNDAKRSAWLAEYGAMQMEIVGKRAGRGRPPKFAKS